MPLPAAVPPDHPVGRRRRYCESNAVVSDIRLAQNLAATNPGVSCRPPLNCAAVPGWVKLEAFEESGYSYTLRGRPRAASATGGAMGGYAIYVGAGGMDLNSAHSDLTAVGDVYVGGAMD